MIKRVNAHTHKPPLAVESFTEHTKLECTHSNGFLCPGTCQEKHTSLGHTASM